MSILCVLCLHQCMVHSTEQWQWLCDAEQACGLLVGRCLGGLLAGPPLLPEEADTARWLASPLLCRGLQADGEQIGQLAGRSGAK